ncbi:MAG: methylmalonyl Co-A mutase-associated GTPase MeaB [Paracoccaceae bacterium]
MTKVQELADKIISGDRRALSRAITLVESSRQDHREEALELTAILTASGRQATRIGLSGTPGVGKSTFIESFGSYLTGLNLRVAVLAVDPSSVRTGGSILGDKTRMDRLSRDANAFIRPSPSQSHLGGVARHTRDVVTICEAAGFDVVMIETVGVGQSETIAAQISDLFVLLLAPAGGDELQGVKRGIMEMADIILVNKADGDLKHAAMRTCADFSGALRLLRHRPQDLDGFPKVIPVSAVQEMGLYDTWEAMNELLNWRKAEGHFDDKRSRQASFWFEEDVKQGVLARLREKDVQEMMTKFAMEVEAGNLLPGQAARAVIRRIEELK